MKKKSSISKTTDHRRLTTGQKTSLVVRLLAIDRSSLLSYCQSLNLRGLTGLFFLLAGLFLALVSFGTFSSVFARNQGATTREQMTLSLAQAAGVFEPPACVPGQEMFTDVSASNPFCPWIEEMVRRGITSGCTSTQYCPSASVTRAQMAPFILKATGWLAITDIANTAVGDEALFSNTQGADNTALGFNALHDNTTGEVNTAIGSQALFNNTTGSANTATGFFALWNNTTGDSNTANGVGALELNTTGVNNAAFGANALINNIDGSNNAAHGYAALNANSTGIQNTAMGSRALLSSTGNFNTAVGYEALQNNGAAFLNTAIGLQALRANNGAANTALGYLAGQNHVTGDDNIYIANDGAAVEGGTIRIGRSFIGATYIAGISGQTASGGAAVFVNADGKLGTSTSSARFKDEIQPMGQASAALFALKPVTFRYKKEIDPQGIPQFGLVAEDVEKINPDLVVRDAEGQVNTVRYEQINAMLLNEFLKEHRKVQELEKQIEKLTAGLQKVSNLVEMSKPATKVVTNQ